MEKRKPAKESSSVGSVKMVGTEVTLRGFAYLVEDGSKHQIRAREGEGDEFGFQDVDLYLWWIFRWRCPMDSYLSVWSKSRMSALDEEVCVSAALGRRQR